MHQLHRFCIAWGILLLLGAPRAHSQLYWNQAASFAGTASSYIAVPNSASLNVATGFTIECWVRPNSVNGFYQLVSKGIASSLNGYDLLLDSGRVRIRTNGVTRFTSTSATRVQIGIWAHVACTYNSTTNVFTTYINGATVGTATVASAAPTANTDSLFIGKGLNLSYNGIMEDVRIWNRDLTTAEIARNRRSALGARAGGVYAGLVLSMPFQTVLGPIAAVFNATDYSGNGNNGVLRGVTAFDLGNRPFVHDTFNEAVRFGPAQGYLSGPNTSVINNFASFTLESWIWPEVTSVTGNRAILQKGSLVFFLSGGRPNLQSNAAIRAANTVVPAGHWSHVAATYNSVSDSLVFYVNGNVDGAFVVSNFEPAANTDSLRIGAAPAFGILFDGLIDEVRISKYEKTRAQILSYMHRSINATSVPSTTGSNVAYNLDGSTYENTNDGGPALNFNGDAIFSNPSRISNVPVSPMLNANAQNFPAGYYLKSSNRRIPETGTGPGLMRNDTLTINQSVAMTDVNFFLLTNHTFDADMEITLFAPNGDSVAVCFDALFTDQDDNIITVFDDNADSSLSAPNVTSIYTSPAPRIKPQNVMNTVFSGDNAQGRWILRINDDAGGDTGRVYAWGIQINNQISVTGVEEVLTAVPNEYRLEQNYPNPFNPSTTIQFAVPHHGLIKLVIFDLLGREVATLLNEGKPAGTYKATFDASRLASGAYFYRLQARSTDGVQAGSFVETKKMILMR
jgi:subtilisin-like proprotein convertase family protein